MSAELADGIHRLNAVVNIICATPEEKLQEVVPVSPAHRDAYLEGYSDGYSARESVSQLRKNGDTNTPEMKAMERVISMLKL
jgi:hypothetical protein